MKRTPHSVGWLPSLAIAALAAVPSASLALQLEQLPQEWRDDAGRSMPLSALAGHRVILSMAYTNCHWLCPATIHEFQLMQKLLDERGEQASFVIVGYDPERDDAAAWHQYRKNRGLVRGNWYFLSGKREATLQLARALGFDYWNYDEHVIHSPRVAIFDGSGQLAVVSDTSTTNWPKLL
jgi:cytochrome oxidase Cu insertion factor (SCO1/SenC/PrrC family)